MAHRGWIPSTRYAHPVGGQSTRYHRGCHPERSWPLAGRARTCDRILPLLAAAFADPGLLDAVRREMLDSFPLNDPAAAVEKYLLVERRLGRVATGADCRAVASILVGLCHDDAFQRHLHASDERPTRHKEITLLVRSLTGTR